MDGEWMNDLWTAMKVVIGVAIVSTIAAIALGITLVVVILRG